MSFALQLLALLGLVLLNAFFVAAEYGLVTARRTRIQELAQKGDRRARAVLRIVADPPRFIAAMQLGVTATSSRKRVTPLPRGRRYSAGSRLPRSGGQYR